MTEELQPSDPDRIGPSRVLPLRPALVAGLSVPGCRAVYAVARQLASLGRLDQEAYDAAHGFLGDAGMVELVSLCGYYTLISFLLNAFAVPLPPGAAPMWAGS